MTEVNVVVVFYSRHGRTEELALAAGLGAVQAHANIRLRRLQDLADAEAIGRDALWMILPIAWPQPERRGGRRLRQRGNVKA